MTEPRGFLILCLPFACPSRVNEVTGYWCWKARLHWQPTVMLTPGAGFAFINADSTTDVCAVEAVKLEDLDPEAVKAGLNEYQAKLGSLQVGDALENAHMPGRCAHLHAISLDSIAVAAVIMAMSFVLLGNSFI